MCVCVALASVGVAGPWQEPVPFPPLSAATSAAPSQGGLDIIRGGVRQETEEPEPGPRSELPTCFELTVRNPMLSPPQVGRTDTERHHTRQACGLFPYHR